MSIQIKCMEMPRKCSDCLVLVYGRCLVNDDKDVSKAMADAVRDEDCPLVPVPPHGDLIERDALSNTVEQHYKHLKISRYDRDLLLHYLDVEMAPAVIPAEEGET